MPANTTPIFSFTPNLTSVSITAATAPTNGVGTIGTNMFVAFQAGPNGSFIEKIRVIPIASVASSSNSNTAVCIYLSTVNSGSTTAANTFLIGEMGIQTTITTAQPTTANSYYEFPLNIAIQSGWYILANQHTGVGANVNWMVTVFGSDY
jgi:hypothetical protein